jgi:hypothetical protein
LRGWCIKVFRRVGLEFFGARAAAKMVSFSAVLLDMFGG